MESKLKSVEISPREEFERQLFGQDMYKYAYKLPLIIINNDSKDSYYRPRFQTYVEHVKVIAELAGQETAELFAEIYKIYKMEDQNNLTNKAIKDFFTSILGQLALALRQATILLDDINNPEKTQIKGEQYCFIALMLNSLLASYSTAYNNIFIKQYAKEELLDIMRERLSFLLSTEFQILRKIFKCVECGKRLESLETIH